jgi:hypothetical protein
MRPSNELLTSEQQTAPVTIALIIACAITGLAVYALDLHTVWTQWTILAHLATGIACTVALLPYFVLHFRRTIGYRRTSLLLSGLLTVPIFCVFLATGWYLMLFGQRENQDWVLPLHIVSSMVFLLAVILHIVFHRVFFPDKRKSPIQCRFRQFARQKHAYRSRRQYRSARFDRGCSPDL